MSGFRNAVLLLLLAVSPEYILASQKRPTRETWYERALRSVNPDDTDYGALFEERKRALMGQLGSRYFLFSLGTTAGLVLMMIVTYAKDVSHRRALEIADQLVTDLRKHDEYARRAAREAIRRYNDHVESCNRVVEAGESGLWQWISSAELLAMNSGTEIAANELVAAGETIKSLKDKLEEKSKVVAEMSIRLKAEPQTDGDPSNLSTVKQYIDRINQLEMELFEEKKKNLRVKGSGYDVRNS